MVLLSNKWGVLVCQGESITLSMSRKATWLDNAVDENFFGLRKAEWFCLERFHSIEQLEKTIADCIDRRIQWKRNGL